MVSVKDTGGAAQMLPPGALQSHGIKNAGQLAGGQKVTVPSGRAQEVYAKMMHTIQHAVWTNGHGKDAATIHEIWQQIIGRATGNAIQAWEEVKYQPPLGKTFKLELASEAHGWRKRIPGGIVIKKELLINFSESPEGKKITLLDDGIVHRKGFKIFDAPVKSITVKDDRIKVYVDSTLLQTVLKSKTIDLSIDESSRFFGRVVWPNKSKA